ncbi:MAG: Gfo/Idh/MocA family oxidoreductase [Bacillota bacterium]|nr:Gfo/Idh/MocA family oxidoreductase [Bacillota bacterium]
MQNNLRIGLISFAHLHASSYVRSLLKCKNAQISGIYDDHYDRVQKYTEGYDIPYYSDYRKLLSEDVDAIIVCSENVLHAEHVIAASRAGKHILCEKPLGTDIADMHEMIKEAKKNCVQLMTAFPNRYMPAVVKLKKMIDTGELGVILGIKATNKGAMPGGFFINRALSGGGSMLDHTVHVMDLVHWFFASEPKTIYAQCESILNDIPVEDAAIVNITLENGIIVSLDCSWSRKPCYHFGRDLTLEITGTKGTVSIDYYAQSNELYTMTTGKKDLSFWGDNKDDLIIEDFVDCILNNKPVPITGEDGLYAAKIALYAYKSAEKNKVVEF